MAFLSIPESDYQGSTPQVNPVVVKLLFDDPLEKDSGRGWTNFYYKVEYAGAEETISASQALHKMIQDTGAKKDTEVKIVKKRIGPAQKDIRWIVELVGGPVDTSKAKGSSSPSRPAAPVTPVKATSVEPPSKEYSPLTEEALNVWILNQVDEASLLEVSLRTAKSLWENLGFEDVDPKAIQATAASLHIQGGRTTGGLKGLNNLSVPDPIAAIVRLVSFTDYPVSFYDAVIANSAWFDEDEDIVNLMKELNYTSMPKDYDGLYLGVELLMKYGELMFEDPDHASAIEIVKEMKGESDNEPAF